MVGQSPSEIAEALRGLDDRFAEAVPGLLLMLGLLATFLGLALAIHQASLALQGGIEKDTTAQASALADKMIQPLSNMLTFLGLKFKTSIWGISGSLLLRSISGVLPHRRQLVAARLFADVAHRRDARRAKDLATQAAIIDKIHGELLATRTSVEQFLGNSVEIATAVDAHRQVVTATTTALAAAARTLDAASGDAQRRIIASIAELSTATPAVSESLGNSVKELQAGLAKTVADAQTSLGGTLHAAVKTLDARGADLAAIVDRNTIRLSSATDRVGARLQDEQVKVGALLDTVREGVVGSVRDLLVGVESVGLATREHTAWWRREVGQLHSEINEIANTVTRGAAAMGEPVQQATQRVVELVSAMAEGGRLEREAAANSIQAGLRALDVGSKSATMELRGWLVDVRQQLIALNQNLARLDGTAGRLEGAATGMEWNRVAVMTLIADVQRIATETAKLASANDGTHLRAVASTLDVMKGPILRSAVAAMQATGDRSRSARLLDTESAGPAPKAPLPTPSVATAPVAPSPIVSAPRASPAVARTTMTGLPSTGLSDPQPRAIPKPDGSG